MNNVQLLIDRHSVEIYHILEEDSNKLNAIIKDGVIDDDEMSEVFEVLRKLIELSTLDGGKQGTTKRIQPCIEVKILVCYPEEFSISLALPMKLKILLDNKPSYALHKPMQ